MPAEDISGPRHQGDGRALERLAARERLRMALARLGALQGLDAARREGMPPLLCEPRRAVRRTRIEEAGEACCPAHRSATLRGATQTEHGAEKAMQKTRAVGIAWYERDDYPRILEIMTDADTLPRTYDAWKKSAEGAERAVKGSGAHVVRAIIEPDKFRAWCLSNGLDVDAKARMRFASETAARHFDES
ncbi:hypothetical protein [Salinarimonas sp.]|uniref:hypothetical protein n=1 Tax=Salinarimonas sp. TaxID=2766526 RepID=UPI00391B381D